MTVISAGNTTSTAFVATADTTGNLVFTTGGANTTALTIDNAQSANFVNPIKVGGNQAINGPAFSAYNSANQSFTSGTTVKVTLDVENFDTNSNFASSRFTPTVAGYYQFNGVIAVASGSANVTEAEAVIYKNGNAASFGTYAAVPNNSVIFSVVSGILYMNGTTDYVELYGYGVATSPYFRYISATNSCQFSGALIRGA